MKQNKIESQDLEMTFGLEPKTINTDNDSEPGNKDEHKSDNLHFDDFRKIDIKNLEFIPKIELKGITDIFNNYATKKTLSTGFFNIALVIILKNRFAWTVKPYLKFD